MFRGELTICPWFSGASHCVFPVISCCSTKLGQRKWCTGGIPTQQVGEMLVFCLGYFTSFTILFWGNHWFWATQIAFRNWLKPKASAHRYSRGPKHLWRSNAYSPTHALQQYTMYVYIYTYIYIKYVYMINWGLGGFFFRKFSKKCMVFQSLFNKCSMVIPINMGKIMGYFPLLRLSTGG